MGRARGANAVMHAAFETTYGTPPTLGWQTVPFVSSQLGATRGLIESDLLGQGRAPFDPTPDVTSNDGDIVVPVDTIAFGYWLKALLGQPADGVDQAAGYSHTFSSGSLELPSMSIEHAFPDVPSYSINYGMRANTLQLMLQRTGLLSATIGFIGKGETVSASTSNVTNQTALAVPVRFAQAAGALFVDEVAVGSIVSANLSFSNGYDKVETIRPDGEIEDADPGMPSASGTIVVKFADNILMGKATANVATQIWLQVAGPNGAFLRFALPRAFLPRAKTPISGPGGIQREFAFQASSTTLPLLRVILNNSQATY